MARRTFDELQRRDAALAFWAAYRRQHDTFNDSQARSPCAGTSVPVGDPAGTFFDGGTHGIDSQTSPLASIPVHELAEQWARAPFLFHDDRAPAVTPSFWRGMRWAAVFSAPIWAILIVAVWLLTGCGGNSSSTTTADPSAPVSPGVCQPGYEVNPGDDNCVAIPAPVAPLSACPTGTTLGYVSVCVCPTGDVVSGACVVVAAADPPAADPPSGSSGSDPPATTTLNCSLGANSIESEAAAGQVCAPCPVGISPVASCICPANFQTSTQCVVPVQTDVLMWAPLPDGTGATVSWSCPTALLCAIVTTVEGSGVSTLGSISNSGSLLDDPLPTATAVYALFDCPSADATWSQCYADQVADPASILL